MSMSSTKRTASALSMTKQSFRDETDINRILARAQKTGTISHLAKHEEVYADFSDFDFFETQLMLTKGREVFDDLPSEIRAEFKNSQAAFFDFVNDPANVDQLDRVLPALAQPGRQLISTLSKESADSASELTASETTTTEAEPAPQPPTPLTEAPIA